MGKIRLFSIIQNWPNKDLKAKERSLPNNSDKIKCMRLKESGDALVCICAPKALNYRKKMVNLTLKSME